MRKLSICSVIHILDKPTKLINMREFDDFDYTISDIIDAQQELECEALIQSDVEFQENEILDLPELPF